MKKFKTISREEALKMILQNTGPVYMYRAVADDLPIGMLRDFGEFMIPDEDPEPKKEATAAAPAPAKRSKVDHGKIMALHKAGWANKKIADEMMISVQTVINHVQAEQMGEKKDDADPDD